MRGNSKRGIARKLKIHARTVARILQENQVAEYQRVAAAIVDASLPDAADVVVDEIIVKRDATCALAVLRGRGVLKGDATTVNVMASNGNVIMGIWPEFAGALPSARDSRAIGAGSADQDVLCQPRTDAEKDTP